MDFLLLRLLLNFKASSQQADPEPVKTHQHCPSQQPGHVPGRCLQSANRLRRSRFLTVRENHGSRHNDGRPNHRMEAIGTGPRCLRLKPIDGPRFHTCGHHAGVRPRPPSTRECQRRAWHADEFQSRNFFVSGNESTHCCRPDIASPDRCGIERKLGGAFQRFIRKTPGGVLKVAHRIAHRIQPARRTPGPAFQSHDELQRFPGDRLRRVLQFRYCKLHRAHNCDFTIRRPLPQPANSIWSIFAPLAGIALKCRAKSVEPTPHA